MGSAFGGSRDCQRVEERLEVYLSGALPDGEERSRITAHLTDCPACRERAAVYTRLQDALSAFRVAPLPERSGDWESVCARLESPVALRDGRLRRRSFSLRPFLNGRLAVTGLAVAALGVAALFAPLGRSGDTVQDSDSASQAYLAQAAVAPSENTERLTRLMGYTTVGTGPNTLTVAPAFVGAPTGDVIPLVVEIGSDREAATAQLEIRPQTPYSAERTYHYEVRLDGHARSRFLVYPSFSSFRDDSSRLLNCDVTLTAPGRRQTLRFGRYAGDGGGLAYVGSRFGAITPRLDPNRVKTSYRQPPISPAYVLPENAPDRAVGYSGLNLLVLSPEAATMNASQWRAIREWVLTGGRLMLTNDRLLDVPAAAELAPVQHDRHDGLIRPSGLPLLPEPKAGAVVKNIQVPAEMDARQATLTSWRMGLGGVGMCSGSFDPTSEAFRAWPGSEDFWRTILTSGTIPGGLYFRSSAHQRTAWDTPSQDTTADDPFRMGLPSVKNVLLVFLGYFVLVVPMTFVVLKHTRRLNLAWATGPILAVAFAGGIFLLTSRLYFMPTARRTAGIVFLNSGERSGRFVGYTEMFFPQAGRYQVPIHNADSVETKVLDQERRRPLDTLTDSNGNTTAAVSVGNLAFRRLHHEQSVTLAGAVTIDLKENVLGDLDGFVENQTGRPLSNALFSKVINVPDANRSYIQHQQQVTYWLGSLPVGRRSVHVPSGKWTDVRYTTAASRIQNPPMRLTFMADLPGTEFGPQTGRDFSGDESVTLMVGVTTQNAGGKQ